MFEFVKIGSNNVNVGVISQRIPLTTTCVSYSVPFGAYYIVNPSISFLFEFHHSQKNQDEKQNELVFAGKYHDHELGCKVALQLKFKKKGGLRPDIHIVFSMLLMQVGGIKHIASFF